MATEHLPTFQRRQGRQRPRSSATGLTAIWSDFNNDGKLDLFVTNDGEANYLYWGDGAGNFEDVALLSGVAANEDGVEQANMGVAFGDYLHNGRMSLALSHFDVEYTAPSIPTRAG